MPARPAFLAVGTLANKKKRPSTDETVIWQDVEYRELKNDLMRFQIAELKSKIERNTAIAQESKLKGEFWEKAVEGLNNNNLILELRREDA